MKPNTDKDLKTANYIMEVCYIIAKIVKKSVGYLNTNYENIRKKKLLFKITLKKP